MVFFLVYIIYAFRGKQPKSLTLNYCATLLSPIRHLAYNMFSGEQKGKNTFFSIMKNLNRY